MLLKMAKYIFYGWVIFHCVYVCVCVCVCVCVFIHTASSWANHLLIDIWVTSMSYRSPFLIALEVNQPEFFSHKNFTDKGKLNHKRGWQDKSRLFKVFPTRVPGPEQPSTCCLSRGWTDCLSSQLSSPSLQSHRGPWPWGRNFASPSIFTSSCHFLFTTTLKGRGPPLPADMGRTWSWKQRGDVPRIPEWAAEPEFGW